VSTQPITNLWTGQKSRIVDCGQLTMSVESRCPRLVCCLCASHHHYRSVIRRIAQYACRTSMHQCMHQRYHQSINQYDRYRKNQAKTLTDTKADEVCTNVCPDTKNTRDKKPTKHQNSKNMYTENSFKIVVLVVDKSNNIKSNSRISIHRCYFVIC